MKKSVRKKYYPTILGAIHLIMLYLFIQALIDFPLAIWDYFNGTHYIAIPIKRIVLSLGSILFIIWYGVRKANTKIRFLFPLKKFNPLLLLVVFIFILGMQTLIIPINEHITRIIPPPNWFWELFDNVFDNRYGFWGVIFRVAIFAPIVEELIFRGLIMHGLMRNYPKIVAIFMSGLLFACFHMNPWQFTATFVLGCLLAGLMYITNNIVACIIGHAINNLLVLFSITYHSKIESIIAQHPFIDENKLLLSIGLIALALIMLGVFAHKNKANIINHKKDKDEYANYITYKNEVDFLQKRS